MNAADLRVIERDLECQRIIKEMIQMAFPTDKFLGEEDVDPGSLASSEALTNASYCE
jgi:fructose-1,6-bisphosphatase/inositol monophosphatase family enzyme